MQASLAHKSDDYKLRGTASAMNSEVKDSTLRHVSNTNIDSYMISSIESKRNSVESALHQASRIVTAPFKQRKLLLN